eukprot:s1497_g3.t2
MCCQRRLSGGLGAPLPDLDDELRANRARMLPRSSSELCRVLHRAETNETRYDTEAKAQMGGVIGQDPPSMWKSKGCFTMLFGLTLRATMQKEVQEPRFRSMGKAAFRGLCFALTCARFGQVQAVRDNSVDRLTPALDLDDPKAPLDPLQQLQDAEEDASYMDCLRRWEEERRRQFAFMEGFTHLVSAERTVQRLHVSLRGFGHGRNLTMLVTDLQQRLSLLSRAGLRYAERLRQHVDELHPRLSERCKNATLDVEDLRNEILSAVASRRRRVGTLAKLKADMRQHTADYEKKRLARAPDVAPTPQVADTQHEAEATEAPMVAAAPAPTPQVAESTRVVAANVATQKVSQTSTMVTAVTTVTTTGGQSTRTEVLQNAAPPAQVAANVATQKVSQTSTMVTTVTTTGGQSTTTEVLQKAAPPAQVAANVATQKVSQTSTMVTVVTTTGGQSTTTEVLQKAAPPAQAHASSNETKANLTASQNASKLLDGVRPLPMLKAIRRTNPQVAAAKATNVLGEGHVDNASRQQVEEELFDCRLEDNLQDVDLANDPSKFTLPCLIGAPMIRCSPWVLEPETGSATLWSKKVKLQSYWILLLGAVLLFMFGFSWYRQQVKKKNKEALGKKSKEELQAMEERALSSEFHRFFGGYLQSSIVVMVVDLIAALIPISNVIIHALATEDLLELKVPLQKSLLAGPIANFCARWHDTWMLASMIILILFQVVRAFAAQGHYPYNVYGGGAWLVYLATDISAMGDTVAILLTGWSLLICRAVRWNWMIFSFIRVIESLGRWGIGVNFYGFSEEVNEDQRMIRALAVFGLVIWILIGSLYYVGNDKNEHSKWEYANVPLDPAVASDTTLPKWQRFESIPSSMFFALLTLNKKNPLAHVFVTWYEKLMVVFVNICCVPLFSLVSSMIGGTIMQLVLSQEKESATPTEQAEGTTPEELEDEEEEEEEEEVDEEVQDPAEEEAQVPYWQQWKDFFESLTWEEHLHPAAIALLGFGSLIFYGLSTAGRGMQRWRSMQWLFFEFDHPLPPWGFPMVDGLVGGLFLADWLHSSVSQRRRSQAEAREAEDEEVEAQSTGTANVYQSMSIWRHIAYFLSSVALSDYKDVGKGLQFYCLCCLWRIYLFVSRPSTAELRLKPLLRRVHSYSDADFRAAWSAVRELVLIETLDDRGSAQGQAIVYMDQLYKADNDGSFAKVTYVACSDEYYQWWTENDMGPNVFHHFCRSSSLRSCSSKVGKEGLVHVLKWAPITKTEAEQILREWGFSATKLRHVTRPAPAGTLALGSGPAPESLVTIQESDHQRFGEGATKVMRMREARRRTMKRTKAVEDTDVRPRGQCPAEKEVLKREPGAILATRAAAVAEGSHKKKRKRGDRVITALKKVVKDEPDYSGDDDDHSPSESSDSEAEGEELLGGSRGSGSAAGKHKKLRQFSEKRPGKLLSMGYATMHDQVGTHFGDDEGKQQPLKPVALKYLLSYALPQFRGGISHDRYRELRTLATSLDHMVAGRTGMAGDLLLQRFKGILMSLRDGSDTASRWIELLPNEDMPTMASPQEDFLARSMADLSESDAYQRAKDQQKPQERYQRQEPQAGCPRSTSGVRGRERQRVGEADSSSEHGQIQGAARAVPQERRREQKHLEEQAADSPGRSRPTQVRAAGTWLVLASDVDEADSQAAASSDAALEVGFTPAKAHSQQTTSEVLKPHQAGENSSLDCLVSACSVRAEGTGGRLQEVTPAGVSFERQPGSQSEVAEIFQAGKQAVSAGKTEGCASEMRNSVMRFLDVLHVDKLQGQSFHSLCQRILGLPKCSLQMGISLAQLLLAHPGDRDHIQAFCRQLKEKGTDTPTQRDLLPFQFFPALGAAVKVISRFPVVDGCIVVVDRGPIKAIPKQQAKKLLVEGCMQIWRWLVMTILNGEYLDWAPTVKIEPAQPSLAQLASMEMIGDHVRTFCGDPLENWSLPNFDQLLQTKSIDYSGDEISHALPLRLEELLPGLPAAEVGGSLQALDVVDNVVRGWLENPEKTLKPESAWPAVVPTAKINASRSEWYRLVKVLYERNILATIEEQDIFKVKGEMVLNGAFAVLKSGVAAEGESRITRLIMNMTPSNAYQMLMRGDLQTLSSATNWASIILPQDHCLLWSSDDQRGAFYAWRLPERWRGLMAFKWPIPGHILGLKVQWTFVCSAVIPMGWLNAVSLFQHLHRRLSLAAPPVGAGFAESSEWRRDRPTPQGSKQLATSCIQYYLDDFDAPEIVKEEDRASLQGTLSEVQLQQRAAYGRQGVDISEKKSQNREPCVVRMGAEIDGVKGWLAAPRSKRMETMGFVLWLLGQKQPKTKGTLMVLGRMVRCFEFQRPLMSVLRDCWPTVGPHVRMPVKRAVVRSLLRGAAMLPMAVSNLRSQVDGLVSASDASEQGGGLCISQELTNEGVSTLEALQSQAYGDQRLMPFRAAGAMPVKQPVGPRIFVLSLFDGVAAVMCALARLPCQIVGFAASEIDAECKRLVRKRWPGAVELGKVEAIDDKVITSLVNSIGYEVDCLLITAGSPCQDLTVLLANRTSLEGSRSKLFFEIPRIHGVCEERFPGKVALMVENVFSMTSAAREKFSEALGIKPVLVQASDISWVRRPRLYWLSWKICPPGDEELIDEGDYFHWKLPDVRLPHSHWVDDGWMHLGRDCLPTFTRALPRSRPPLQPAGINSASAMAIARWTEDRHQFQVYQYEDPHLLWQGGNWRLPSLTERERLMGFDVGYISNALPSKLSDSEKFRVGRGMIGNTFHVHSVGLLFHELISTLHPLTPARCIQDVVTQVGVAPKGWADTPHFVKGSVPDPKTAELVHEILRQGDRAGSDIRLDVGIPFRFKAFPRAGLRTSYFSWRIVHGYKWRHSSHINALELQAVVNSVQWRLRKLANHRKRVLHLVDSQVVACVVAKGRTSSFRLRKALQKLNCLLLASGTKLCIGYCHTSENPADIPSRWSEREKPRNKEKRKGGV